MTRIAFIGAGSVEFTRDLLGDILRFPELAGATIALHDIDRDRPAAPRVVGLCHSVHHTTRQLAGLAGVPYEEVTYLGAGVNHQAWILRFERDGESLYPLLDAAIARDPELLRRVRVEMYRRYGYFPTESSEHSAEYLPFFLRSDEMIDRFRVPVDEYLRRS